MTKYSKKIVLFTLFVMNLVDEPAPEVTIAQGTLVGKISKDGTFFEYAGIPYATSNKSTRFKAPGSPPSWKGIYKAVDEYHMCPQNTIFGVMGSEDCLKINIYVPSSLESKRPLPVMVYIHGGAFMMGSGGKLIYGPRFLVKKDVIMVTFNYRIGLLGFLCLKIKDAPGNAGLKDQIAALRWVKRNIAAFGGDPDNVTIFGESAGGTSASILLASEITNGLFKRAIIQSGTSVSNWSINRNPIWVASLLAKSVGYDTEDSNELYKIFNDMDYKDIIMIKVKRPLDVFFETQLLYLPCVEDNITGIEPVITDLPFNIFANKPKDIDVIYGTTSNEGILLVAEETAESLSERNGRYLFASDLEFETVKEARKVAQKVQRFYFGDDSIGLKNILNVSEIYTHLYFEIPAIFEAEYLSRKNKSKVYNYIFDYYGGRNFLKLRSGFWNVRGACHGDDLFYLFDGDLLPLVFSRDDQKIVDHLTTLWTNFAKYGNPTPESSDITIRWMPSSQDNLQFLYINNESKMGTMPNPKAYQLWKDIYNKYPDSAVSYLVKSIYLETTENQQ